MVGKKRLELLSLAALVPKTSAYTNSATCPFVIFLLQQLITTIAFLRNYKVNNKTPYKQLTKKKTNIYKLIRSQKKR